MVVGVEHMWNIYDSFWKKKFLSFSRKKREKKGKNNFLDDHLTQINVHVSCGQAVQIECPDKISPTFIQRLVEQNREKR